MATKRSTMLKHGLKFHGWLAFAAAVFVFWFILSGLTHILMVWTGPKQTSFFPPQTSVEAEALTAIPAILAKHQIETAHLIKVVPTEQGNALQVTTHEKQPRRYFDLQNHQEWPDYDAQQAVWLAHYYTGLTEAEVASVNLQTRFDSAYPAVNRLLPVYRVQFATADNRVAFVYTEIAALANLTNDWKTTLQGIFTAIHTLNWLDNVELLRVLLLTAMVLCVIGMILSGLILLLTLKRRTAPEPSRRWHRRIGMTVILPVFAFALSGVYHLYQYAFSTPATGLQLSAPFAVPHDDFTDNFDWLAAYEDMTLNHIALIQGPDGDLVFRVSLPNNAQMHHAEHDHSARFKGLGSEQGGHYYPLTGGDAMDWTDASIAEHLATQYSGLPTDDVLEVQPVHRFSPEYDFRNKRLPVWRVDYADNAGRSVFVDPATGMLIDITHRNQRLEAWSFSWLHKWSFMSPWIGNAGRDALMIFTVLLALLLAALGIRMKLRRR